MVRRPSPERAVSSLQLEYTLERTQVVPVTLEDAFAFFGEARNLETITPPWLEFAIVRAPERLQEGSLIHYRLQLLGMPLRWLTEIHEWRPPRSFSDRQLVGPYPLWEHTHRFTPHPEGTEVYDHVRYRLPGGPLAPLVHRLAVGRWLEDIFTFRARRLEELLR
jgi:ligand-binding SRPBCC domain-containing protein